jgi:dTDP-4-dehydrorhamnose reductase
VSFNLVLDDHFRLRKFASGIYHAVPTGETTWYSLACLAVQTALDAGATLKAHPSDIKPILAVEYPLPAPRPMNSRMSTDKLHQIFAGRGDVSELEQLNQPWDKAVRSYVTNLAEDGLI